MNCRTHEHRHFERILLNQSLAGSMFDSGSVKHPSSVTAGIEALLLPPYSSMPLKFWVRLPMLDALATLGIRPGLCLTAESRLDCLCFLTSYKANKLNFRPESKQDYPPNLSILISGGKENNCDCVSNGE